MNSQKLANQSREAVNGDAAAFKAVRATKAQIETDMKLLNDRFGSAMDVSGPIGAATATWVPMGKSADQILASESAVLALAGNAKNFSDRVPQLQAQLDEMGRAMSSTGSAPSQVFMAVRQSVLAASMAKSVAEMRAAARVLPWPVSGSSATRACSHRCSTACAKATRRWACRS